MLPNFIFVEHQVLEGLVEPGPQMGSMLRVPQGPDLKENHAFRPEDSYHLSEKGTRIKDVLED